MKHLNPHGDEEYATLLQRQGRIMRKQILCYEVVLIERNQGNSCVFN
jgi:hypothetical protein